METKKTISRIIKRDMHAICEDQSWWILWAVIKAGETRQFGRKKWHIFKHGFKGLQITSLECVQGGGFRNLDDSCCECVGTF